MKAVLLHNGNVHPSIPLAHSVHLKEDYFNIKLLLTRIKYNEHLWKVCGDFKMLGFLLGLQGGYTKLSGFLCIWDSRADHEHYKRRVWPKRETLSPGSHNVLYEPLVDRKDVMMPPFHIKLGLAKQFVKSLKMDDPAFCVLREIFPKHTAAKMKGGIFTGPEIRKMFQSADFAQSMTISQRNAWNSFRGVVHGFLGNRKDDRYEELVETLLDAYRDNGYRMSIKLHYLHSHLDFFSQNMGSISEEHGERFHQDIRTMELRYQGRRDNAMMGDYTWNLIRQDTSIHKRKSKSNIHF